MKPYGPVPGGVRLAVRVLPRASRDALDGVAADKDGKPVVKIRLAAPPVEGAANAALLAFLAESLSLRRADITVRSGETGRLKILHLAGDSAKLLQKLDSWLS